MKPLIDGKSIDRETAEEAICEECGSAMDYEPRYKCLECGSDYGAAYDPGEGCYPVEYHAWAVCANEECGHQFEF